MDRRHRMNRPPPRILSLVTSDPAPGEPEIVIDTVSLAFQVLSMECGAVGRGLRALQRNSAQGIGGLIGSTVAPSNQPLTEAQRLALAQTCRTLAGQLERNLLDSWDIQTATAVDAFRLYRATAQPRELAAVAADLAETVHPAEAHHLRCTVRVLDAIGLLTCAIALELWENAVAPIREFEG